MTELADPYSVQPDKKESKPEKSGDESTYQLVTRLMTLSKRHRELWDRDWNYNYNFVFGGRQWGPNRPKWRFSESVNVTWGGIMQEVGVETDSEQQTDFVAEEPTDVVFTEILKQINNRNWQKYDWGQKFVEAKIDSKVVHVVHTEVRWNPKLENGLGDAEHVNLNPFYLWWDPQATDINDARWIIYAPPTPTSILRAQNHNLDIKPDIEKVGSLEGLYSGISSPSEDIGLDRGPASTGLEEQASGGEELTKWIRVWIRDESVMEEKEGESFVLKKKYPHGRYIECINKKIIRDAAPGVEINGEWVEYKLCDMFPIARLVNYAYPRRYAGGEEVTQLKGPQKLFNYTWSYAIDHFKASINPKIVVTHKAGELAEEITNEPNQIVEVPTLNDIQFIHPPGMAAGVSNVIEMSKNMIDLVRGSGEISGGKIPSNVSSGVFLETSIEIEQTRSRLKARNAKTYLRRLGQLDLQMYLQFYRQPRVFRITNKEGYPEHVEFYISGDGEQKQANISKLDQNGSFQALPPVPVKGVPDVRVTVGSSLPFAKAIKNDSAKDLFVKGAIDREALFDMIDLNNKEAVLKRMEEKEAQMAQAQAAPA